MAIPTFVLLCSSITVKAGEIDTTLPDKYISYIIEISEEYCVQPELIEAIIEAESGNNNNVVSDHGAVGFMQVIPKWHKDRAARLGVDIEDPYGNILVGTDYLMELADEYYDLPVVLAVYNGDSRAFEEDYVSDYAQRIIDRSRELEILHYGL